MQLNIKSKNKIEKIYYNEEEQMNKQKLNKLKMLYGNSLMAIEYDESTSNTSYNYDNTIGGCYCIVDSNGDAKIINEDGEVLDIDKYYDGTGSFRSMVTSKEDIFFGGSGNIIHKGKIISKNFDDYIGEVDRVKLKNFEFQGFMSKIEDKEEENHRNVNIIVDTYELKASEKEKYAEMQNRMHKDLMEIELIGLIYVGRDEKYYRIVNGNIEPININKYSDNDYFVTESRFEGIKGLEEIALRTRLQSKVNDFDKDDEDKVYDYTEIDVAHVGNRQVEISYVDATQSGEYNEIKPLYENSMLGSYTICGIVAVNVQVLTDGIVKGFADYCVIDKDRVRIMSIEEFSRCYEETSICMKDNNNGEVYIDILVKI